jgi:kexin
MVGFNSRNLLIHLFLLGTFSGSSLATPAKRTYSTHHYYSLELSPDLSTDVAQGIASSIGAELVEQIGELKGHWLVRAAKGDLVRRDGEDPVLTRWNSLQTSQTKRSLTSSNTLRSLTHLPTRARTKRVLSSSPKERDDEPTPDSRELEFAQSTLQLLDPMFPEQWHLINTQRPDIELNVTGLWSRGVDGRGVKVAIIDDGLDMHSDDLADNFVSFVAAAGKGANPADITFG